MMYFKKVITAVLLAFFLSTAVHSKSFTSLQVTQKAHSLSCLDYKITGPICIYLHITFGWSGVSVHFHFRDRINHRLPDLVVSAYEKPGGNPWSEMKLLYGQAAVTVQNSPAIRAFFGDRSLSGAEHENKLVSRSLNSTVRNKRFHEVQIIGSPAPDVVRNTLKYAVPFVLGKQYMCKSSVTKFKSYFMSETDSVAWRKPELEVDQSWRVPFVREIGSKSINNPLGNTWGKVIPRTGFVMQTEPAKAAAVAAQRAIDVVTQRNQVPHVYISYGTQGDEVIYNPGENTSCNGGFGHTERNATCVTDYNNGRYPPGSGSFEAGSEGDYIPPTLDEACPLQCYNASTSATKMPASNEKDKAWQMISPVSSSSCEAFGSDDKHWARNKNNEKGEYAWNYWREYECCKPAPGILLNP